jgi:hypothetical protein
MAATGGRIVQTPTEKKPYKVVLEHDGSANSEQGVDTIREGETLIREETPKRRKLSTLLDQPASDA